MSRWQVMEKFSIFRSISLPKQGLIPPAKKTIRNKLGSHRNKFIQDILHRENDVQIQLKPDFFNVFTRENSLKVNNTFFLENGYSQFYENINEWMYEVKHKDFHESKHYYIGISGIMSYKYLKSIINPVRGDIFRYKRMKREISNILFRIPQKTSTLHFTKKILEREDSIEVLEVCDEFHKLTSRCDKMNS